MNGWELGEKEFLVELHKKLGNAGLSWRDDCIEKQIAPDLSLVYSIDSISQRLSHNQSGSPKTLGKWAASVIASDVIACGVAPQGLALDIGSGAFQNEREILDFVDGVIEVCSCYGMNYEGGNMNKGTYIGGVSWGIAAPNEVIHRDGAKLDSILLATAPIGLGWAMELLQRDNALKTVSIPNELIDVIHTYKEMPIVDLAAFQEVWKLDVIDCGMDLTDGIIEFGYEIFDRTGFGVVFLPQKPHSLVRHVASLLNIKPEDIMFEPGFDTPFAHGWCIQKDNLASVKSVLEKRCVPYTILGEVTDKVSGVYRRNGSKLVALPRYWDDKLKNESSYDSWVKNIMMN